MRLCSLVFICSFPQLAKTVDAGAVGVAVKSLRDKRERVEVNKVKRARERVMV